MDIGIAIVIAAIIPSVISGAGAWYQARVAARAAAKLAQIHDLVNSMQHESTEIKVKLAEVNAVNKERESVAAQTRSDEGKPLANT